TKMNLDQIFDYILKKPQNYPGKHLESQPRTNPSYKPLEPKAQFHIIFKATSEYILEKMKDGKGVNIPDFGAFTFEVFSDWIKPAQHSNFDITKDLDEQRTDRKHVHKIRPCFIPNQKFKYALNRYPGKEEISAPKSQHSIYQKGFGMTFCNAGPIAASCFLGKDVVQSAHYAFISAVQDLTTLGYSLVIDLQFVKIMVQQYNLKYQYRQDIIEQLNRKQYELKLRKSDTPSSEHWTTTYQQKWGQSSLNTLLKRPNSRQVRDYYEKTLALKIMS
ncbi:hypothetical protein IMG5_120280, partial [Ichthyophthirius multifiliis]